MSVNISRDEWLRALNEAGIAGDVNSGDPAAVTIPEFAAMLDVDRFSAKRRLDALVAAGKAAQTTKRQLNSYGRRTVYKAYRLTDTPKPRR